MKAIVDNVHRLGVLVRKLPGLKRGPAVAVLLKAAGQVEPFRHAVQHLDGEIEGLLADGRPLRDSLSWVNWGAHRRTDWSALALRLLDAGGQSDSTGHSDTYYTAGQGRISWMGDPT